MAQTPPFSADPSHAVAEPAVPATPAYAAAQTMDSATTNAATPALAFTDTRK